MQHLLSVELLGKMVLESDIHDFTHFSSFWLHFLNFLLIFCIKFSIFTQIFFERSFNFFLFVFFINFHFKILTSNFFYFFFFFFLNKQNVLTRQQLELDWLGKRTKTSICIVVGTGFFDSLFFLRSPFASLIGWSVEIRHALFDLKRRRKRPRNFLFLSLTRVDFSLFCKLKMALKRFSYWKLKSARLHKCEGRERQKFLMEINSNWIHAIASALSFAFELY